MIKTKGKRETKDLNFKRFENISKEELNTRVEILFEKSIQIRKKLDELEKKSLDDRSHLTYQTKILMKTIKYLKVKLPDDHSIHERLFKIAKILEKILFDFPIKLKIEINDTFKNYSRVGYKFLKAWFNPFYL